MGFRRELRNQRLRLPLIPLPPKSQEGPIVDRPFLLESSHQPHHNPVAGEGLVLSRGHYTRKWPLETREGTRPSPTNAYPSESVRPFLQVAAFGEACGAVGGFFVAGAG